jgi:hypothetical protein
MWRKHLVVNCFGVYVTKFVCCETLRNRKDRWITVYNVPTRRWLVLHNGTFCLKPNATLVRFHCLLLITACNSKLFQYEYIIVSHALRSTNCAYTDPLHYHGINEYSWINFAVYCIINVSTDNCLINSIFFYSIRSVSVDP